MTEEKQHRDEKSSGLKKQTASKQNFAYLSSAGMGLKRCFGTFGLDSGSVSEVPPEGLDLISDLRGPMRSFAYLGTWPSLKSQ